MAVFILHSQLVYFDMKSLKLCMRYQERETIRQYMCEGGGKNCCLLEVCFCGFPLRRVD